MLPIILTRPEIRRGEAMLIGRCTAAGFRVHLRKPHADEDSLRGFITECMAQSDPTMLTIHYREDLATEFGLGVHLPLDAPRNPDFVGMVSRSCHTVSELIACNTPLSDYLFLSPVFDSISKPGYEAAFEATDLQHTLLGIPHMARFVALGGVTADHITQIHALGFDGYAVLGSLWRLDDSGELDQKSILENLEILQAANEEYR